MQHRAIDNPPFSDGLFSEQQTVAWELLKTQLPVGTVLTGLVFIQAPFGVFFDAAIGFPILLELPDFAKSTGFMQFPEDYPPLGSVVSGILGNFDDEGRQIRVTKRVTHL